MLKKSEEAKTRTSLEVRCGQCVHFKTGPKHYEDVCKELGVKASASPCDAFYPDVSQIQKVDQDAMSKLRDVLEKMDGAQTKILAVFMARTEWFKKAGLTFGQEVVFCFGQNYLSNYARGYVVGVTRDGEEVFLQSTLEKLNRGNVASVRLMRDSILTLEDYRKLKAQLIKDDKIIEPSRAGTKITLFQKLTMTKKEHAAYEKLLSVKPDDYVPPTLDTVPDSWRDSRALTKLSDPLTEKKNKKKSKSVIKINRG